MRRSPQLTPLSHDHHVALEVALRLRRATPDGLADAVAMLDGFWHGRGAAHFAREEDVLTVALVADDPTWVDGVARMHAEHATLRRTAGALLAQPTTAAAVAFGAALRDHVRFEERELFPLLEQHLDGAALDAVGAELTAG
jgi:hypothetical protein